MALETELGDPITQRSGEAEGQLCSQVVETLKSEGGGQGSAINKLGGH